MSALDSRYSAHPKVVDDNVDDVERVDGASTLVFVVKYGGDGHRVDLRSPLESSRVFLLRLLRRPFEAFLYSEHQEV